MAKLVTLHDADGEVIYPQSVWDENMIPDNTVKSSMIDWASVMDVIYPVGSIYMSATMSTVEQVQTALGGTWVVWGKGRVPVGVDASQTEFDTVEETGGEKTHTLIVDEIPSHDHNLGQMYDGYHLTVQTAQPRGVYADFAQAIHTSSTGGGQAHNNLQPYITCYMYKRTA